MRLGVLADTHGLLRPETLDVLAGCELLIHAGDVGKPSVLEALRELAPVVAVRGNVDGGELAALPETEAVEAGGATLFVLHILDDLDLDPVAAGFQAVIYGHSHRPEIRWQRDVLFLNPGSCGPRRFSLPVTVAVVDVPADGTSLRAEIVPLIE